MIIKSMYILVNRNLFHKHHNKLLWRERLITSLSLVWSFLFKFITFIILNQSLPKRNTSNRWMNNLHRALPHDVKSEYNPVHSFVECFFTK